MFSLRGVYHSSLQSCKYLRVLTLDIHVSSRITILPKKYGSPKPSPKKKRTQQKVCATHFCSQWPSQRFLASSRQLLHSLQHLVCQFTQPHIGPGEGPGGRQVAWGAVPFVQFATWKDPKWLKKNRVSVPPALFLEQN